MSRLFARLAPAALLLAFACSTNDSPAPAAVAGRDDNMALGMLWRGQLKERHPATGLVQRTNVYRLGDGYWDCYREEELQAA